MQTFLIKFKHFSFVAGLGALLLLVNGLAPVSAATFKLDFQADDTHEVWGSVPNSQITCNFAGHADNNCEQGGTEVGSTTVDADNTPFLLEKVLGPDGNLYFHMVMGDPNSDMAQEYYINTTGGRSSSNGDGCFDSADPNCGSNLQTTSGNGWDPLAKNIATTNANTGNGSADPNKVIMRQVTGLGTMTAALDANGNPLRDCISDLCQEFIKATLANKPVITQAMVSVQGGDTATASFKIDMSNSNYLTATAAASITNTLDFSAFNAGDFNQATDAQNASVTGGQYTYTPGTSPADHNGSGGTFSSGFDPATFDYGAFRDPSQNSAGAGNAFK